MLIIDSIYFYILIPTFSAWKNQNWNHFGRHPFGFCSHLFCLPTWCGAKARVQIGDRRLLKLPKLSHHINLPCTTQTICSMPRTTYSENSWVHAVLRTSNSDALPHFYTIIGTFRSEWKWPCLNFTLWKWLKINLKMANIQLSWNESYIMYACIRLITGLSSSFYDKHIKESNLPPIVSNLTKFRCSTCWLTFAR